MTINWVEQARKLWDFLGEGLEEYGYMNAQVFEDFENRVTWALVEYSLNRDPIPQLTKWYNGELVFQIVKDNNTNFPKIEIKKENDIEIIGTVYLN